MFVEQIFFKVMYTVNMIEAYLKFKKNRIDQPCAVYVIVF